MSSAGDPTDTSDAGNATSSIAPQNFPRFPKLPPEIRLRIQSHSLSPPQVWEIEWDSDWAPYVIPSWRVCPKSRPNLPPLHGVNAETRAEFLTRYTAFTLHAGRLRKFDNSYDGFFNFETDTLYIGISPLSVLDFLNELVGKLNPSFLDKVQHLAIQGDQLIYEGFENQPRHTKARAVRFGWLLARFSSLKTLSVVVGDDHAQEHGWIKPNGLVELTELTCGQPATDTFVGAKEQFRLWMQSFLDHNLGTYGGSFSIKQALRGGILDINRAWDILD